MNVGGRSRSCGQAMVEFALCCAVLVAALLLPWGDEPPVIAQLAQALLGYLRGISFLLSVA